MATAKKKATPSRAKVARNTSPTKRKTLPNCKALSSRAVLSQKSLPQFSLCRFSFNESVERSVVLKKGFGCGADFSAQVRVVSNTGQLAVQPETAKIIMSGNAVEVCYWAIVDTKADTRIDIEADSKNVVILENMLTNQLAAA